MTGLRAVARRVAVLVLLLWIVSIIVFGLSLLIPGDPASALLGDRATPEQTAALRAEWGLDEPVVTRYLTWLGDVMRGDLGTSLFNSYTVTDALRDRAGVSVSLVGGALAVSAVVGVAAGTMAATHRGGAFDRVSTGLASLGLALPVFWLALVLATVFGAQLGWFPATGYATLGDGVGDWLSHLFLPVAALAIGGTAEMARETRVSVSRALEADWVRTLRAKGLTERSIVVKHVLRNALVPVVTVSGLQVSRLFGMAALVEAVFGLPGVGSLMVRSVFNRDVPVVQGVVLVSTAVVVLVNLLVDLCYGWLDPKVARR